MTDTENSAAVHDTLPCPPPDIDVCRDCVGLRITTGYRLGSGREFSGPCERCGGTGVEPEPEVADACEACGTTDCWCTYCGAPCSEPCAGEEHYRESRHEQIERKAAQ